MYLVMSWEEEAGGPWGSGEERPGSLISFAFEDRGEGEILWRRSTGVVAAAVVAVAAAEVADSRGWE